MTKNSKIIYNRSENTLHIITSEFPQYKNNITRLFYESTNFIEICEDYVICLESLRNLEAKKGIAYEKDITEFKLVIAELKEELLSKV